jgi:hypothetical protein
MKRRFRQLGITLSLALATFFAFAPSVFADLLPFSPPTTDITDESNTVVQTIETVKTGLPANFGFLIAAVCIVLVALAAFLILSHVKRNNPEAQ